MFNISNPETVLKDLASILPVIYSSLEHGIFEAKEFFGNQKKEENKVINRYLAPSLVRYYALQVLAAGGHNVREDTSDEYTLERVPNNGMYLKNDFYNLRILKSNDGELPIPGHSKTRQLFYHQTTFDFANPEYGKDKLNLIMLWNVDNKYDLQSVTLACPRSGGRTRSSVETHWHFDIPSNLLDGSTIDFKNDQETSEIKDLPTYLKRKLKIGTEGPE